MLHLQPFLFTICSKAITGRTLRHCSYHVAVSSFCPPAMAFFLCGFPNLLWAVHEYLGISVAPAFCSAAMDLVPPLAVQELTERIAAVEQLLCILRASNPMLGAAEPDRIAQLLLFLRHSKTLVELVTVPLRRLQSLHVYYPPFTEASEVGLLLVARPFTHS